jgi:hypothetical protein
LLYFEFNNAFLEKTDLDRSKSAAAGSSTSDGSRREQQQQQQGKHTKRLKLELRAMRISSRLISVDENHPQFGGEL